MKVLIGDGLVYLMNDYGLEVVDCPKADAIARANDLVYAERFVKKHKGFLVTLGGDLKIIDKKRIFTYEDK